MWLFSLVRSPALRARREPVTRSAFLKYKVVVCLYFVAWLGLGLYLWVNWTELSRFVSWPLAAVEGLLAPDTSIFRRIAEGFDSYAARAARGEL